MRDCARRTLATCPAPPRGPAPAPSAYSHCGRWRTAARVRKSHRASGQVAQRHRPSSSRDNLVTCGAKPRFCASPQPNRHTQRSHPRVRPALTTTTRSSEPSPARRRRHHRAQRRDRRPTSTTANQPRNAHRSGRSPARGPRPAAPDQAAVPDRAHRACSHTGGPRTGRGWTGLHIGRRLTRGDRAARLALDRAGPRLRLMSRADHGGPALPLPARQPGGPAPPGSPANHGGPAYPYQRANAEVLLHPARPPTKAPPRSAR